MRGWRPEPDPAAEPLPPKHQLPDPPWEYHEIEVMKAFGCWNLAAWRAQSADDRARMMAHETHRALREQWAVSKARPRAQPAAKAEAPWDLIRRKFLGGGIPARPSV